MNSNAQILRMNFVPLGKFFTFHDDGFICVGRKICSLGGKRKVVSVILSKKGARGCEVG